MSVRGRTKKKNKGLFLNERKDYQYLKLVSGINGTLQRIKHPMVWKNQRFHRLYEESLFGQVSY